jgi:hypothetical protein
MVSATAGLAREKLHAACAHFYPHNSRKQRVLSLHNNVINTVIT